MILSTRPKWTFALLPILLLPGFLFAQEAIQDHASAALASVAIASKQETSGAKGAPIAKEAEKQLPESDPPGGKRVFGVLPNYRTVDDTGVYTPITVRRKMVIASKDSFDYPLVLLSGALAGIGQLSDENTSFGQGLKGYGHRLVTSYADQAMGNMFTEGIFPSLLHEDPRYFRRGTGRKWSRTGYALTRIFVTHTDSGATRFNYSEWLGNAAGVAISNAYYPESRTASESAAKLLEQCSTDAISQVLKEFWPDIKRKLFQHNKTTDTP